MRGVRPLVTLTAFKAPSGPDIPAQLGCRTFASASGAEPQGGRPRLALAGGLLGLLAGATLLGEELETRKVTAALERGAPPAADAPPQLPQPGQLLQRPALHARLTELCSPYCCSMSHTDLVAGPEGCGATTAVRAAVAAVPAGAVYVDLHGEGAAGARLLQALTGHRGRGLLASLRDLLHGGVEQHALALAERGAHRFTRAHGACPVLVFDHVAPAACRLGEPGALLRQLGRLRDAEAASVRTVLVLSDAGLEALRQLDPPPAAFRVAVAVEDPSPAEAAAFLQQRRLPAELAQRVAALVGGRLGHLQAAAAYWAEAPRWLSPMRPGSLHEDAAASVSGHFAESRKLIYWELDKRLRVAAGIALWPAATGDAPVRHQSPTDEDAARIVALLADVSRSPLPREQVAAKLGEARLLQLLQAQVLGLRVQEGPLERADPYVCFGSPAMASYFRERLAPPAAAA